MLLAHDVDGGGDPVVLLHSSVCDRRMFDPQWTPLLDRGCRALRCDLRGFGDTPAATEAFSNAEDVRDLLDACDLEQVTIVGASYGGRVGQEIAARWPDRVTRLVLLCAVAKDHPPTAAIQAFRSREDELIEAGDVDAAVALNVDTFLGPRADADTREFVGRMQRHGFEVQLAAPDIGPTETEYDVATIAARTLVVSGAHDLDFFREIADDLTARIPGATQVRLGWAGHLPSLEDPDALNPVLFDFLGS